MRINKVRELQILLRVYVPTVYRGDNDGYDFVSDKRRKATQDTLREIRRCIFIMDDLTVLSRENYLVNLLNRLFKIQDITYGELNKTIPIKDTEALRALEQECYELGVAKFDTPEEGVSVLSLFATITDVFCGKRLAFSFKENHAEVEEGDISNLVIDHVELLQFTNGVAKETMEK